VVMLARRGPRIAYPLQDCTLQFPEDVTPGIYSFVGAFHGVFLFVHLMPYCWLARSCFTGRILFRGLYALTYVAFFGLLKRRGLVIKNIRDLELFMWPNCASVSRTQSCPPAGEDLSTRHRSSSLFVIAAPGRQVSVLEVSVDSPAATVYKTGF
jgi:hypothetical protein